jgi:PfaD family protein
VYAGTPLVDLARRADLGVHVVRNRHEGSVGLMCAEGETEQCLRTLHDVDLIGSLPPLLPQNLGDSHFARKHDALHAYIGGEMAKGIATTSMVIALARAGFVGIFGSGGLDRERVERAVDELHRALPGRRNWGVNLINAPHQPDREQAITEIVLSRHVPIVSASAFMSLAPSVVRCSISGLTTDHEGNVVRPRTLIAKVSRPEVAELFLSPAPGDLITYLRDHDLITDREAALAALVSVADDVTVEADSGGHTDNRPLGVVLPAVAAVRDDCVRRFRFERSPLVGAAGGLGTPHSVASAFALGADYVLTGSVNQAAVESGLVSEAKELLAQADITDTTTAPSADMFELGATQQVLHRGTMFANRANMLAELYRRFDSLDTIPARQKARLERDVLRGTVDAAWADTVAYWQDRDSAELERAAVDPKHRMALIFRSYLGQSSRWPVTGNSDRRHDYQIWCGPAMGAFNRWSRDGYLADPDNRTVVQIARNLLGGAAVVTRLHQLRTCGLRLPTSAFAYESRRIDAMPARDVATTLPIH